MPEYINAEIVRQVMRTQRWLLPAEVRGLAVEGVVVPDAIAVLVADSLGSLDNHTIFGLDGAQRAAVLTFQGLVRDVVQKKREDARAASRPSKIEAEKTAQRAHIQLGDGYGNRWHYVATPGVALVCQPLQAINVTSITVEWPDVS